MKKVTCVFHQTIQKHLHTHVHACMEIASVCDNPVNTRGGGRDGRWILLLGIGLGLAVAIAKREGLGHREVREGLHDYKGVQSSIFCSAELSSLSPCLYTVSPVIWLERAAPSGGRKKGERHPPLTPHPPPPSLPVHHCDGASRGFIPAVSDTWGGET